jgi:voltage-gated potassium channel Kch
VPFVTAYTAILGAAVIFRKQLDLLRLKFRKNHTIICGLGEKGWHLASQLQGEGEKVVVIEKDPANPRIALCREMGMIVLERNAQQPENLSLASVQKAHHLVAVCGDDSTNAQIAVAARELSRQRKSSALHCTIHITDPQLSELLRELEFGFETFPSFRLEIFNIFERGARFLVSNYTDLEQSTAQHINPPQILVVGCSHLGESLILHMARTWFENQKMGSPALNLTVVDQDAQTKINQLAARYPKLCETCQ